MSHVLTTARAVVDALGGAKTVASLTNRTTENAVYNWTSAGRFPADTYLVLTTELRKLGKSAPDSLWAMGRSRRVA